MIDSPIHRMIRFSSQVVYRYHEYFKLPGSWKASYERGNAIPRRDFVSLLQGLTGNRQSMHVLRLNSGECTVFHMVP